MKLPALALVCTALLAGPQVAYAQSAARGVNGYLTLANGYWNRGLSQNDEGVALQLGVDYQHRSGLFVGGTLADVDYPVPDPRGNGRETEMDVYLGFHRRNPDWSWTLTLGQYSYPDSSNTYGYTEASASVGFRDRVFFSTTYSDDFFSLQSSAWNSELSTAFPLAWNLELSATVGRFDVDVNSSSEYTHWNVGISKLARRVVLDLRYYDSGYERLTPLGDPSSDQYVLSVTYAFRGARLND
jgi:uncharacterized protein (TIGR02001 family)